MYIRFIHLLNLVAKKYNELLINTLCLKMKLINFKYCLLIICTLTTLLGCSQAPTKPVNVAATVNAEDSLFIRLGGLPVIRVVVSETIDEVSSNPKTSRSFKGIKLVKLKESVVNQICKLTGGGCEYDGETMINSHKDAKITTAEFELFVAVFRESLNRHTNTREKNELLKILAPMKREIVSSQ